MRSAAHAVPVVPSASQNDGEAGTRSRGLCCTMYELTASKLFAILLRGSGSGLLFLLGPLQAPWALLCAAGAGAMADPG